jgi:hypothetical protein
MTAGSAAWRVLAIAGARMGCGLVSTKVWWPSACSARVACSKWTVRRRLRYQYPVPRAVVSVISVPVTVE